MTKFENIKVSMYANCKVFERKKIFCDVFCDAVLEISKSRYFIIFTNNIPFTSK